MQVNEISLKDPLPIQKFGNEPKIEKKIEITPKEALEMEAQARDPIAEKKQTQDYKLKAARERLEKLEEDAAKLENEMKMQNEHLDRIHEGYKIENDKQRKEFAVKFIENTEKHIKDDEENDEEDERVSRILSNNQELYNRIQRALTPKIKEIPPEEPVKEPKPPADNGKINKINPIVSKRISAAMNTAAQAIHTSKSMLTPKVLKKVKK